MLSTRPAKLPRAVPSPLAAEFSLFESDLLLRGKVSLQSQVSMAG